MSTKDKERGGPNADHLLHGELWAALYNIQRVSANCKELILHLRFVVVANI